MTKISVPLQFFGSELRLVRQARGMTQDQLAEATNYSPSMVAMVESGRRTPSAELAATVDQLFETGGQFGRIRQDLITREVTPDWFRPWREYEAEATALLSYEPLTVPGLVQTEAYARALMRWAGDNVDERVADRLDRQRVFARERPLTFVAVLDEGVLRRPIGGAAVMHEQLSRLAELARDQVLVQVVPLAVGAYRGLDGAFVIGTVGGHDVVYVQTPARGYVVEGGPAVSEVRYRWDIIRADALSRQQSLDLILEAAEQWRSSS